MAAAARRRRAGPRAAGDANVASAVRQPIVAGGASAIGDASSITRGVFETLFGLGFGHDLGRIGGVAHDVGGLPHLPHRLVERRSFSSDWKPLPIFLSSA